jgi:putative acetyltransferase
MKKIRSFIAEDQKDVLEIYALSKLDELQNEKERFELLPLEKDSKRFNKLMESDVYVYDDQIIKGYCAFLKNEITALFVHPLYRKTGIGISMLEFMLSYLGTNAILYVAKSNVHAKTLYQKYGFEIVDEFQTDYNGISVLANKMKIKKIS